MNLLKGYYTFYKHSTLTDSMIYDTQHTTSYMILWYTIMTGLPSYSGLYKHNLIRMCSSTQEQDDNIEGARVARYIDPPCFSVHILSWWVIIYYCIQLSILETWDYVFVSGIGSEY